jgi:ligand-binding sensor domain-containing protein/two-component sensor histidine kinase
MTNHINLSKYLLLVFILLSVPQPGFIYSQPNRIQLASLTTEDGLSINSITQIVQDSKGFIWVGTYNGLHRYDGYNFKIFLPDPQNSGSISNHSITAIYEDSERELWIGTKDGLNKYDRKKECFIKYHHKTDDKNCISDDIIYSIIEDKEKTLWIGTENGINKYNRSKNNFANIDRSDRTPNDKSPFSITCITEAGDSLWLGTWHGLYCIDKRGKILKQFYIKKKNEQIISNTEISSLLLDSKHNLWIGKNGEGVDRYNTVTGEFYQYKSSVSNPNTISNDYINIIYQDSHGNLWIGTKKGLNEFDYKTNSFKHYYKDTFNSLNIINVDVLTIGEDKTGIIWIGTSGGISRFYEPPENFHQYIENKEFPNRGISNNRVNAVIIDREDNLWLGTLEGLDKKERKTNRFVHYKNQTGKNSLSNDFIRSLLEDHLGYIWIGTSNGGLNRLNPKTGEFKIYKHNPTDSNSLSNDGIVSLCEDKNGNLWIGTFWGLNYFDRKSEKFTRYQKNPNDKNSIRNNLIWAIIEDAESNIWIGTDGDGVSKYDPTTKTFYNFYNDSTQNSMISGNRVVTIYKTENHTLWFGTPNGMCSYSNEYKKFTNYADDKRIAGIHINGFLEDEKNNLWISTNKGILKFDVNKNELVNYSLRDGLNVLEYSANVNALGKDGTFYFGSKAGLTYFQPDKVKEKNLTAPVVFTDLKVSNESVPITSDGSSVLEESITSIKGLKIPFNTDVITIDFALLDFFNVKKNNFSYKLEGFDKNWNEVGNRNNATYTNLAPGNYVFTVSASNYESVKKGLTAYIRITILPAFYHTYWFRVILITFLVLLVYVFINRRTIAIKKQNKILEDRVIERTKELDLMINELSQEVLERKKAEEKVNESLHEKVILLKEIHHRVKNNLQVIYSLLSLQMKSLKDDETINLFKDSQYRIRCMALIHEKLYQSKDFAEINFREYVHSLLDHLNKSFHNQAKEIHQKIDVADIKLSLDTAISCGLIINEIVTNAYKYAFPQNWIEEQADGKELKIEIGLDMTSEKDYLLIISDNGVGIPSGVAVETTESLGLKLVYSLAQQLEGSVEIDSSNGTMFKIYFEDI